MQNNAKNIEDAIFLKHFLVKADLLENLTPDASR